MRNYLIVLFAVSIAISSIPSFSFAVTYPRQQISMKDVSATPPHCPTGAACTAVALMEKTEVLLTAGTIEGVQDNMVSVRVLGIPFSIEIIPSSTRILDSSWKNSLLSEFISGDRVNVHGIISSTNLSGNPIVLPAKTIRNLTLQHVYTSVRGNVQTVDALQRSFVMVYGSSTSTKTIFVVTSTRITKPDPTSRWRKISAVFSDIEPDAIVSVTGRYNRDKTAVAADKIDIIRIATTIASSTATTTQ